jgi:hypothetical protein
MGVALYMRRELRAGRRTDGRTDEGADMAKVIGAFRDYTNASDIVGEQKRLQFYVHEHKIS